MTIEMETRRAVDALYAAYFAGDGAGMVDAMAEGVHVRFLGRVSLRGKDAARAFLTENTPMLTDLDFRITRLIVDGSRAAAVWEETAVTVHGEPYQNHGVDVFEVRDGEIVCVHENNDVVVHRSHFG